jgi:hypothetical protein
LDRSVRLVRAALAGDRLSLIQAIRLVERYIARNEIARASHEKAWRERHKDVAVLLL